MTSGTGCRNRLGFTLLEVMTALAIVVVMISLVSVSFKALHSERELVEPVLELQKLSKLASKEAAASHKPIQLRIFPRSVVVQRITRTGEVKPQKKVSFPETVSFSIKPFGMSKWTVPPEEGYAWLFEPSGLCEPLSIKLERGESFYTVTFDPLTGGVRDEQMVIME